MISKNNKSVLCEKSLSGIIKLDFFFKKNIQFSNNI